jgi:hypothetical protein
MNRKTVETRARNKKTKLMLFLKAYKMEFDSIREISSAIN